ncbi:MAG: GNAT family N-acyltransferase [Gammaproteobacteria bacterium]|nr:GNAT family N-acyltransferase [Gammaproteobacteria bacterium]
MSTPCEVLSFPEQKQCSANLIARLANTSEEIRKCQRLRYDIFANEMGANIKSKVPGLDVDQFDSLGMHLMVIDNRTNDVVGTTRLIMDSDSKHSVHFYSETEFDLRNILQMPGRFMEVGRTCIHPDYRNGSTIAVLWQGLARIMVMSGIDYLIGCASIPMDDGGANAKAIMDRLRDRFPMAEQRVYPYKSLPQPSATHFGAPTMPSLLKAYLRIGATICGEAYWDVDFNVADVFVFVSRNKIDKRYSRHFVQNK